MNIERLTPAEITQALRNNGYLDPSIRAVHYVRTATRQKHQTLGTEVHYAVYQTCWFDENENNLSLGGMEVWYSGSKKLYAEYLMGDPTDKPD